jgi:hypothetical protein
MGIENKKFYGHYRGTVIENFDPKVKGRCKIWVRAVYPEEFKDLPKNLPWAEPAMPIFGGSYKALSSGDKPETGMTGPPHIGAELWLFFEQGDHNYPIYCFAAQSGPGWMSEHKNQHVIQTDNVRIRIDEEPTLPVDGTPEKSTSKFDSYNTNCTHLSKPLAEKQIPTRLDIDVLGNVNIVINGSTNMLINGNVYQEINGDKHETLIGNHYIKHVGDLHIEREGDVLYELTGDTTHVIKQGDYTKIRTGDEYLNQEGNYNEYVSQNYTKYIGVSETRNVPTRQTVVSQYDTLTVLGTKQKMTKGLEVQTVAGHKNSTIILDTSAPIPPPLNGSYYTTCAFDYVLTATRSIYTTALVDRHNITGYLATNTVGTTYVLTAGQVINEVAPRINLN